MADARTQDEWSRLSVLLALVANAHRDPKKTRAFKPADFDPFAKRVKRKRVSVAALKDVFVKGRMPKEADS